MTKKKGSTISISSSVSHDQKTSVVTQFHRWSKHEMEMKVGKKKAQCWIESKLLVEKPDRITGSMDPDCVEYLVPVSWTQELDESTNQISWKSDDKATDEDLANTLSVQLQRKQSSATLGEAGCGAQVFAKTGALEDEQPSSGAVATSVKVDEIPIKTEKQTPEYVVNDDVQLFLADPIPTKLRLQSMEVECDKLIPAAKKNPFIANFGEALEKHSNKVRKMLNGVTRVVQGSECNAKKMPALLCALDKMYARHDELLDFAKLNNLTSAKRRRQGK